MPNPFIDLSQTPRAWAQVVGNINSTHVFASAGNGIYKQTNGVGNFVATSLVIYNLSNIALDNNGYLYASGQAYVSGGYKYGIHVSTDMANWTCIVESSVITGSDYAALFVCPSNNNVYAAISGASVWVRFGGTGSFIDQNQASRGWTVGCEDADGNVLIPVLNGGVYIRHGGVGDLQDYGIVSRAWACLCCCANGDIYGVVRYTAVYSMPFGTTNLVLLTDGRRWMSVGASSIDLYACTDRTDPSIVGTGLLYSTLANLEQLSLASLPLGPDDSYEFDCTKITVIQTYEYAWKGTKGHPVTLTSSSPGTPARIALIGSDLRCTNIDATDIFCTSKVIDGRYGKNEHTNCIGIVTVPTFPVQEQVQSVADGGDTYGPNGTDYSGAEDAPAIGNVRDNDTLRGVTGELPSNKILKSNATPGNYNDDNLSVGNVRPVAFGLSQTGDLSNLVVTDGAFVTLENTRNGGANQSKIVQGQSITQKGIAYNGNSADLVATDTAFLALESERSTDPATVDVSKIEDDTTIKLRNVNKTGAHNIAADRANYESTRNDNISVGDVRKDVEYRNLGVDKKGELAVGIPSASRRNLVDPLCSRRM
jgi:hypothetical protein